MFSFDKGLVNDDCGSMLKLYGGAIYCAYVAISLFISWQFMTVFSQITKFVLHGILRTEKERKRKNILMAAVWLFVLLDWITYSILNNYFTEK